MSHDDKEFLYEVRIHDVIGLCCDPDDPHIHLSLLENLLDKWGVWNGQKITEEDAAEIIEGFDLIEVCPLYLEEEAK